MIYDRYQLIDSAFKNLFEGLDKFEDDGYFDLEAEPKQTTLDADIEDKEVIENCNTKRQDKSKKDLEEAEDLSVVTRPKKEKRVDKDWAKFYRSKRAAKVESKDSCLTEGSKKVKARIKRASTREALTEAADRVTLEVIYKPYERYGGGSVRKTLIEGTDELDALKHMTDRMYLWLDPDQIEEDHMTVDEIIDKLDISNGDECDFIMSLVNLNTGKILIQVDGGYEEEIWDNNEDFDESYQVKACIKRASSRGALAEASDQEDANDEDFDESYRVKAKINRKGLKESCNTRKFLRRK